MDIEKIKIDMYGDYWKGWIEDKLRSVECISDKILLLSFKNGLEAVCEKTTIESKTVVNYNVFSPLNNKKQTYTGWILEERRDCQFSPLASQIINNFLDNNQEADRIAQQSALKACAEVLLLLEPKVKKYRNWNLIRYELNTGIKSPWWFVKGMKTYLHYAFSYLRLKKSGKINQPEAIMNLCNSPDAIKNALLMPSYLVSPLIGLQGLKHFIVPSGRKFELNEDFLLSQDKKEEYMPAVIEEWHNKTLDIIFSDGTNFSVRFYNASQYNKIEDYRPTNQQYVIRLPSSFNGEILYERAESFIKTNREDSVRFKNKINNRKKILIDRLDVEYGLPQVIYSYIKDIRFLP